MVDAEPRVAPGHGRRPAGGARAPRSLQADGRLEGHHRLDAVRAHLLEMAGDEEAAIERCRRAADLTENVPEQRYLAMRAERGRSAG